jgi:hypothetical protein
MNMQIRVVSQSIPDYYHLVTVSDDGAKVSCSCPALGGFCSHIDAVLVANERAMVHPDDLAIADEARALTLGKIAVPSSWKGSWRGEFGWRGLKRQAANYNPGEVAVHWSALPAPYEEKPASNGSMRLLPMAGTRRTNQVASQMFSLPPIRKASLQN